MGACSSQAKPARGRCERHEMAFLKGPETRFVLPSTPSVAGSDQNRHVFPMPQ